LLAEAACARSDCGDKGLDWSDIQGADGAIAFAENSPAKSDRFILAGFEPNSCVRRLTPKAATVLRK
jgi:hypothetical protein